MSSDQKQDVVMKTVENERIQIGVLKALVDEAEEHGLSEDDEEANEASDESEKSGDTNISGLVAVMIEYFSRTLYAMRGLPLDPSKTDVTPASKTCDFDA